jgi:hypothetical protein
MLKKCETKESLNKLQQLQQKGSCKRWTDEAKEDLHGYLRTGMQWPETVRNGGRL